MVPACRIHGKILDRPVLPLALDRGQALKIALDLRIGAANAGNQAHDEVTRGIRIRQAEEGPGPFLVAADQPCLQKQLQVPRNARLRLAENFGKIGNGEVTARQKCQYAQSAGFGRRL